jgi:outer membrane lipoprotein-sorting protein
MLLLFMAAWAGTAAQNAREIVRKSNDLMRAKSSIGTMSMKIIKPDWQREMTMKMWALEPDFGMVYITAPAKSKGTVTLKRKNEVWNWIPSVRRTIKIPPSMMLQSWMGSDFTNDDLVRQSSIVEDYNHKIIGQENINGYDCYKIEMIPKPEAGVVWDKIYLYVSVKGFLQLKAEYYDEEGSLVKTMLGSDIKVMDGRKIPAHWEMIPHDKPGSKTIMDYIDIRFNVNLKPSFFSLQNMQRVR